MGLGDPNQSQVTYLQIKEGQIAVWNKATQTNDFYPSVEGYITQLQTRAGKFGDELIITLKDDKQDTFKLQLLIKGEDKPGKKGRQTSAFIAFAHVAPAIDVTRPVKITPRLSIVEDKKRLAVFFEQNGQTLKWAFKRGDEGVPQAEELKNSKGELVSIDYSELENYRLDKVNELQGRIVAAAGEISAAMNLNGSQNKEGWQKAYETPKDTFGNYDEDVQDQQPTDNVDDLPF